MWLLVLPFFSFMTIGGNISVSPIYWFHQYIGGNGVCSTNVNRQRGYMQKKMYKEAKYNKNYSYNAFQPKVSQFLH
jgi:hypothetical protein